jgi:hypothetical protein
MQLTHRVETGTLTFLIELTMIARAKDTVSPLLVFQPIANVCGRVQCMVSPLLVF